MSVVYLRNSRYLPLVLSIAHILQLFAVAYLNVGNYSFTLFALSILITDVMLVKTLKLFWVRNDFPL